MNNSIHTPQSNSLDSLQAQISKQMQRVRISRTKMVLQAWKSARLFSHA